MFLSYRWDKIKINIFRDRQSLPSNYIFSIIKLMCLEKFVRTLLFHLHEMAAQNAVVCLLFFILPFVNSPCVCQAMHMFSRWAVFGKYDFRTLFICCRQKRLSCCALRLFLINWQLLKVSDSVFQLYLRIYPRLKMMYRFELLFCVYVKCISS